MTKRIIASFLIDSRSPSGRELDLEVDSLVRAIGLTAKQQTRARELLMDARADFRITLACAQEHCEPTIQLVSLIVEQVNVRFRLALAAMLTPEQLLRLNEEENEEESEEEEEDEAEDDAEDEAEEESEDEDEAEDETDDESDDDAGDESDDETA